MSMMGNVHRQVEPRSPHETTQPALRAEGTQVNLAFGSGGSGPLTLAGPRQYVFMRGPLKIGFIKETV